MASETFGWQKVILMKAKENNDEKEKESENDKRMERKINRKGK